MQTNADVVRVRSQFVRSESGLSLVRSYQHGARQFEVHGKPTSGSRSPPSCCHYYRADQHSPTSLAAADQPCCRRPAVQHTHHTQPRWRPSVSCSCAKKLASISCSHTSAAASACSLSKQPGRGFGRACVSTAASHSTSCRLETPRLLRVQRAAQRERRGERGCAAWLFVAGKLTPGV